jgi:hypothetical protein
LRGRPIPGTWKLRPHPHGQVLTALVTPPSPPQGVGRRARTCARTRPGSRRTRLGQAVLVLGRRRRYLMSRETCSALRFVASLNAVRCAARPVGESVGLCASGPNCRLWRLHGGSGGRTSRSEAFPRHGRC